MTGETLAAFNAKRLGIDAAQPPETPKVEAKPDETVQVDTPNAADAKEADKSAEIEPKQADSEQKPAEEPQKKPRKGIDERFSELTKARKDAIAAKEVAEARARALEERVKAIEEGKPKPADPDAKPNPDSFKDAFTYAEALAKWSAENAIKAERERSTKEAADKAQETIRGEWAKNVAAVKKTHEDYEEVVRDSDVYVNDHIRDAILESGNPLLIYHLAQNPDEADKLNELSPRKALLELGKLEAKLTAKPESKKDEAALSKAPPPINPLRGSNTTGGVPVNGQGEFTGTYAEYKAARLAGKIK